MIKLNLSEAINLLDYNLEYNKINIYLGYVETKGYVFIQEKNNTAWFTCIKSNNNPIYLSVNWQNDMAEIEQMSKLLEHIFKGVPNEEFIDIKTDVIDELLSDLSFKYESYDYINPKSIRNTKIKEFTLNPVEQFNFYLNLEKLPFEEYKREKIELDNELEKYLTDMITLFNDKKAIYGEKNTKGDIAPLITENNFIKLFNEIVSDAFANPIVNLKYGNGKTKLNTIEAIDYITEEFNIKGIYESGSERIYYFNDELNYFEILTEEKLKNLIIKHLGIKLLKSDYNNIYKSFETNDKAYDNILVFRNILFDIDNMQELNFPVCNYNRCDYLAPALIGYETTDKKIELLDYDFNFDLMELYNTNPNLNEITFVEKTLRQILIPKDNPSDLSMFIDFLQRVGSNILGVNKYKTITLYYGSGNNGKGILKLANELVFNKGAYSLTPQTFDETFNLKGFKNRKVLLLDEIDANDFKNLKPTLKRISSPEGRVEQRGMFTDENIILNNFPNLFMFSNVLINLNLDEYALFDRFDFLKLPNTFVSEKELNKSPNSYLKDRETETKFKSDTKGLSWLITASIEAFKRMLEANSEYTLKQTTEQTMDILLDTDHLTKFIRLYTYEDETLIPNEYTTVEEIFQQYQQYMELNGNIITDTEIKVKRQIGTTIKKVYNITGKVTDSEMYYKQDNKIASYRIKLKSFDEVNTEFKQVYVINEDVSNENLFSTDSQVVYSKIQNGVNTINLLNKELPNLDNHKIVKELLNLNLIIKTNETNIKN